MAALLELEGLSKSFGALKVIDGLDVRLDEGEALGVVGPNGAGKTTMLHLAAGQLRPDAGRVRLGGRDVTGLPARARCQTSSGTVTRSSTRAMAVSTSQPGACSGRRTRSPRACCAPLARSSAAPPARSPTWPSSTCRAGWPASCWCWRRATAAGRAARVR